MNCPGCNHSEWEYPDYSIARCKNCGYLLDPYVYGLKKTPPFTNSRRSDRSKHWAIIAFSVSIFIFIVSIWIPDWSGFWVAGLAVSIMLWLDYIMQR